MAPTKYRLELQRNHPARDSRHVQKVVDQIHEVLDLALDDVAGANAMRLGELLESQELNSRANRRERIAQLVRKHRQEFVFAVIGFLQRLRGRLQG